MEASAWEEAEGCPFHIRKLAASELDWSPSSRLSTQASFGGPIASLDVDEDGIGTLDIFSSTGRKLSGRSWIEGRVSAMGWITGLKLILVLESGDGIIVISEGMAPSGGFVRRVSNGDIPPSAISCVCIWEAGCVMINRNLQVLEFYGDRVMIRAKLSPSVLMSELPPRNVSVLRPSISSKDPSHASYIVVLPEHPGVVIVETDGNVRAQFPGSDMSQNILIAPHPSYRLVAVYGKDHILRILPQDFIHVILEYECPLKQTPDAVLWCGQSTFAICICFPQEIVVVPLEHIFPQLSRAHLSGSVVEAQKMEVTEKHSVVRFKVPRGIRTVEMDGVRITGESDVLMLRQAPTCWRSVFRLGSTEPGAMLLDAVEMIQSSDADGYDTLKFLVSERKIEEAVLCCLDAAEHSTSYDPSQHTLVNAALFGKRFFVQSVSPDSLQRPNFQERRVLSRRLVTTCRFIRLCKGVLIGAGMAITTKQLRFLTPAVLIDRLLFACHFDVAAALSEDAGVDVAHVVIHWASRLAFEPDKYTDEQLQEIIIKRIEMLQAKNLFVSMAPIAAACLAAGRRNAMLELSTYESCLAKRVLLLITGGFEAKAISILLNENGVDPDLIQFAVSRVVEQLPWAKVLEIVKNNPNALALFATYLKTADHTAYKRLLLETDQKLDKGLVLAEESSMSMDTRTRIALMKEAATEFKDSKHTGLSQVASDQARLMERQNQLGDSVVGLSLANTVLDCIRRGLDDEADSFARDFGLRDSIFRRIQIRGLAARKAWTRIQDLSCQPTVLTAIDLADIAEVCATAGNTNEALRYVHQLADTHERKGQIYLQLRQFDAAVEPAFAVGDRGVLEAIRKQCPHLGDLIQEKLDLLETNNVPIGFRKASEPGSMGALDAANRAAQGCAQQ